MKFRCGHPRTEANTVHKDRKRIVAGEVLLRPRVECRKCRDRYWKRYYRKTSTRRRYCYVKRCPSGHEYSGDNLIVRRTSYVAKDGTTRTHTHRACRTCQRQWERLSEERRRRATADGKASAA